MKNDDVISRFDKGSKQYRTDSIPYRKRSADLVSRLVSPVAADVILDIGCGTGTQLVELAKTIEKGIGIDSSTGMVQRAKDMSKTAGCINVEFHIGDFLELERKTVLRNRKINKIISNYALHHLDLADKKRAIEKMIDVAGDDLEMIVIGDLMFFDDPQKYKDQYDQIGYGPENDSPCYAEELESLFDKGAFTISLECLHPLVGVLRAVKNT